MPKTALSKKEWLDHLVSQERGDATQREYCRENGLSLSAFRYWKKNKAREATSETKTFIEIPTRGKVPTSPIDNTCTINFPNGCSLRVRLLDARRDLRELAAMVNKL